MKLYFAYGSNLDLARIKSRCPDSSFREVALLEGYQLCFPLLSEGSGVASIRSFANSIIYGAIYNVSHDDIAKLNTYEGYEINGTQNVYNQIRLRVRTLSGEEVECLSYVAICDHADYNVPTEQYLGYIVGGLKRLTQFGVPTDYIEKVANAAKNIF